MISISPQKNNISWTSYKTVEYVCCSASQVESFPIILHTYSIFSMHHVSSIQADSETDDAPPDSSASHQTQLKKKKF